MKVRELIEILQKADLDATVVLSWDPEGNGFSEMYPIEEGLVFLPWDGKVRYTNLTDEMRKQGYDEEDIYEGDDGVPAVVLRP